MSNHYSVRVKLEGEPLKAGQRGLVVSPAMKVDPYSNVIVVNAGAPDAEELRAGLLFWDRLEWPTNNMVHQAHTEDFEFLISEGVLTRSRAELSGSAEMARGVYDATRQTYAALDDRDQGRWTVSRRDGSSTIIGDPAGKGRGLSLTLYRAIPVPAGEVPFDDVLRFREMRRAELSALRAVIDEAYLEILAAPDAPLAEIAAVDRIDAAVRDLLVCSRENKFRQLLSNLDFSFDWKAAGAAGYTAISQGLPLISAAAGAVGAGFGVATAIGTLRQYKSAAKSPYEYAVAIHKDLRWTG
ncbi:hypothetical protein EIK56_25065 [Sphingomonas sp. C8-2]|nr:hypothetical protein EIK56_25065 [Sphingomonas sp. C8-2]